MGRFDIRRRLLPLALIMLAALCGFASGAFAQQHRPSVPMMQEAVVVIPSRADFAECIGTAATAAEVPSGIWHSFIDPAHRRNYSRGELADMLEQGDPRLWVSLALIRRHAECYTNTTWESDAAFLRWFRTSPQLSEQKCSAGPRRREYLGQKDYGKFIHFGFVRLCEPGEMHLAYLGHHWLSLKCVNTIPPPEKGVVRQVVVNQPLPVPMLRPRPPIICVVCKNKQQGGVPTS